MKFIDLFAGLGGFHNALEQLGHECVFASELKSDLREIYKKNYGCEIHGDITKIATEDIPSHDILCAGFPCQPFSHAGKRYGLNDNRNGNLFYEITRILRHHKPKYILLENVANLLNHDGGKTWKTIRDELMGAGYDVKHEILSPHEFGIPHNRRRIFIVGVHNGNLDDFHWPQKIKEKTSLFSILDREPHGFTPLPARELEILGIWQEFLNSFPVDKKLPSFPIWTTEFGATYPYEKKTVYACLNEELENSAGSFGIMLKGLPFDEKLKLLPKYALYGMERGVTVYPKWKIDFIRQNREFYADNEVLLKEFVKKLQKFPLSFQKFEWNCQGGARDLFKHVVQFRPSGVRVKKDDTSPALISSTSSQTPIVASEKRYLSKHEASKLQGMGNLEFLPTTDSGVFRALGNAVNSDLVRLVAKELIR